MTNKIVHFMQYGLTACMRPGPPSAWPEGEVWSGEWTHVTCPECLKGADERQTFTISPDGKAITCLRCGLTSYNPTDVEVHYCGKCRACHDDIWPPARHWWVTHTDDGNLRPPLKKQE